MGKTTGFVIGSVAALAFGFFNFGLRAEAWKPLFNGKNLDGWEVVNGGNWSVEDGAIVVHRLPNDTRGGWLVTRADYSDFVVRLKFWSASNDFNSGILIRDSGHAMVSRPAFHGFEIQIQQGERDPNTTGAIYDVARAYPKTIGAKEWADLEVRCEGDHITTFFHGEKLAETHTRRSYFGAIGLQMHGGKEPVEYRFKDIEIQELPRVHPGDALMLEERFERSAAAFRDLWTTDSLTDALAVKDQDAAAWTLRNGVLHGSGSSRLSGVLTKTAYRDYLLTFDARVQQNSEAAVALRDPGPEPNSDASAAFQCAISSSFENPSGSLIGLAPGMVNSDWGPPIHRPDKWNNFRVYVQGDHVVTYVNLSKTADVHAKRPSNGHIGFYVKPGSTVDFQNVHIKVMNE